MMNRRIFLFTCTAILTSCATADYTPKVSEPDAVYYLVRHAEKTRVKKDPGLTEEGKKRAQDLALRLGDVPLTKIYSSDYIRTRETAAPIAKSKNLKVEIYDPRNLEDFSKKLSSEKGHILVAGHSNTTPNLSALLGGEAGKPIIEATEYDRLYIVTRRGTKITSKIERYGD